MGNNQTTAGYPTGVSADRKCEMNYMESVLSYDRQRNEFLEKSVSGEESYSQWHILYTTVSPLSFDDLIGNTA